MLNESEFSSPESKSVELAQLIPVPEPTTELPEALASFDFQREVRMADTDATGYAQFGSYIRMMEETEYAFLRSRGLRVVLYDDRGTMGFPRLQTRATVYSPLRFGDKAVVRLHLSHVDGKQVDYRFEIFHHQAKVADGFFKVAFCRFPDHQVPYAILIPDAVLTALQSDDSLNALNSKISLVPCPKKQNLTH